MLVAREIKLVQRPRQARLIMRLRAWVTSTTHQTSKTVLYANRVRNDELTANPGSQAGSDLQDRDWDVAVRAALKLVSRVACFGHGAAVGSGPPLTGELLSSMDA